MARTVQCVHLKKEGEGMDYAPYPGDLGKRIYNQVSKEAWQLWMKHQTMLVNENRLNLADQRARQYLARQMERYFFGEGADQPNFDEIERAAGQPHARNEPAELPRIAQSLAALRGWSLAETAAITSANVRAALPRLPGAADARADG